MKVKRPRVYKLKDVMDLIWSGLVYKQTDAMDLIQNRNENVTFPGEKLQAPDEIASPLQHFRKFISDEMLTAAVENTNLYRVRKDGKSVWNRCEGTGEGNRCVLGIVKMPGVRYYWESETRYPPVASYSPSLYWQLQCTWWRQVKWQNLEADTMDRIFSSKLSECCAWWKELCWWNDGAI